MSQVVANSSLFSFYDVLLKILLLVDNARSAIDSCIVANDLKKGGLFIIGHVIVGEHTPATRTSYTQLSSAWLHVTQEIAKMKAFIDLTISPTIRSGVQSFLTVSGLGGMKPNIVLLGAFRGGINVDRLSEYQQITSSKLQEEQQQEGLNSLDIACKAFEDIGATEDHSLSAVEYVGILNDVLMSEKNLGIMRYSAKAEDMIKSASKKRKLYIDVWPLCSYEMDQTLALQLQLGTILHMTKVCSSDDNQCACA